MHQAQRRQRRRRHRQRQQQQQLGLAPLVERPKAREPARAGGAYDGMRGRAEVRAGKKRLHCLQPSQAIVIRQASRASGSVATTPCVLWQDHWQDQEREGSATRCIVSCVESSPAAALRLNLPSGNGRCTDALSVTLSVALSEALSVALSLTACMAGMDGEELEKCQRSNICC